ncbi:DMT family transporter [Dactylosporangium sp. NPDC006015]|uniref:EamA family transporter n=1 Tax=Dactylosporangium sp. NPDC006015 TaxID=3154576 RepID=UPI0033A956A8
MAAQTSSSPPVTVAVARGPEPARRGQGRLAGYAAVVVAAALWGFGGTVASRLFDAGVDPLELVATRTFITLAGLALLVGAGRATRRQDRQDRQAAPERAGWAVTVGFGVSVAVANGCLFLAIQHLPVAVAMVLQNLAPALVVGWLILLGRRRMSLPLTLGLAAALLGVALVVRLPETSWGRLDLVGIGFGLATAAGVAAFSVLGSAATRAHGALRANVYAFAVSSVVWLVVLAPGGAPGITRHGDQWPGIVFVGVLGTLVPFLLYAWGTARVGAQAGAVNISLEPVFSAALAWWWLSQRLTAMQIAGGVVLVGAVIALQHLREHPEWERPDDPLKKQPDDDTGRGR